MSEETDIQKEVATMQLMELRRAKSDCDGNLASIKGMTNVFIVAAIGFIASAAPITRYGVKSGIEVWWLASSIGCVLAVAGLFIYIMWNILDRHQKMKKISILEMQLNIRPQPDIYVSLTQPEQQRNQQEMYPPNQPFMIQSGNPNSEVVTK